MWLLISAMAILTIVFIKTSLKPYAEEPELPRQTDFTNWNVHIDAYSLVSGRISEPIGV